MTAGDCLSFGQQTPRPGLATSFDCCLLSSKRLREIGWIALASSCLNAGHSSSWVVDCSMETCQRNQFTFKSSRLTCFCLLTLLEVHLPSDCSLTVSSLLFCSMFVLRVIHLLYCQAALFQTTLLVCSNKMRAVCLCSWRLFEFVSWLRMCWPDLLLLLLCSSVPRTWVLTSCCATLGWSQP